MMASSLRMQAVIATLNGFWLATETLIELFDHWVMARGGQSRHIKHAAQLGAAAVDMTGAALLATVAIKWRDARPAC